MNLFNLKFQKSSWTILVIFAVCTLAAGMLAAWGSFNFIPVTHRYALPAVYPPAWMFWGIWMVLYPCMGISAGQLWLIRNRADVRGALALYFYIITGNFMFLPISNLSGGVPAILTLMDINGMIGASLFGWLCFRYSLKAFYWILPLIIWMPITAVFKILLWGAN